jgi:hypothetical protein
MVFDRLEVEGRRVIERMIGHWAMFGRGRSANIATLQVGNLSEPTNLTIEELALRRGKILAKPKKDVVN